MKSNTIFFGGLKRAREGVREIATNSAMNDRRANGITIMNGSISMYVCVPVGGQNKGSIDRINYRLLWPRLVY